jgi:hypothetical protein
MALTEDRSIQARHTGRLVPLQVAAGAVIHLGAIVAVDAAGWAVPAAAIAGQAVAGVAQERVDNTHGGNGARTVCVQKGVFGLANSASNPLTQAHVGRTAYVEDDGTVANASAANQVVAGVVDELGDHGLVYVFFA